MISRMSTALGLLAVCALLVGCEATKEHKAGESMESPRPAYDPVAGPCESAAEVAKPAPEAPKPEPAAPAAEQPEPQPVAPAPEQPAAVEAPEARVAEPAKVAEPKVDEPGKPLATVKQVKAAPEIDGKIGAEEWGEPALTGFYDEVTGKKVPQPVQTQVWLAYDAKHLYIAAKMMEPEAGELVALTTERDGQVWNDDAFEVFLDPGKTKDPAKYYQIIVNPAGTVADQKGAPDVAGDPAWDCEACTIQAGKADRFWAVEMAIPLEALGVTADVAGKRWGANFARERKCGAAENSTWVNMGPQWHQPEEFGTVVFEK